MSACETCADRAVNGRNGTDPIHCRHCHLTWTGNEAQHCVRSGVLHASWGTTVARPEGDPLTLECAKDGAGAEPESFADALRAHAGFVQLHRNAHVQAGAVMDGVGLWRHDFEIARIVVGLISVPVVDVLIGFGSRNDPMFVGLDDLVAHHPPEDDVSALTAVTTRRDRRLGFTWTQPANRPLIGPKAGRFASVAATPLAGRSRYGRPAVNASDLSHTVIVQWLCHRTFAGISAADSHRYRRLADHRLEDRCIDPAVTDGWREKRPGVWTNAAKWEGM